MIVIGEKINGAIPSVAKAIAEIKGVTCEEVVAQTEQNAKELFL